MKPTKFAIAAVIMHPEHADQVLAVKRPSEDDSLPDVWGLPAVNVTKGELPEDALRRIGAEKLATRIEPVSYVGIKRAERAAYELILMDIVAKLTGDEPSVRNATTTGTKYVDQQWTNDYSIFIDAARKGSLCSRVFLESKGMARE